MEVDYQPWKVLTRVSIMPFLDWRNIFKYPKTSKQSSSSANSKLASMAKNTPDLPPPSLEIIRKTCLIMNEQRTRLSTVICECVDESQRVYNTIFCLHRFLLLPNKICKFANLEIVNELVYLLIH